MAAAGLWIGGVGKDQELGCTSRTQSGTGPGDDWDRPLIGPDVAPPERLLIIIGRLVA